MLRWFHERKKLVCNIFIFRTFPTIMGTRIEETARIEYSPKTEQKTQVQMLHKQKVIVFFRLC
jgi:hypothetical protein